MWGIELKYGFYLQYPTYFPRISLNSWQIQLHQLLTASILPHVRESGFRNPGSFCLWNPESWALESGIQHKESGILLKIGIQNPTYGLSYSLERKTSYGKPPQGIYLKVMTYSLISAYLVSKPYFTTSSIWRSRSRSAREPLLMSGWQDHKIRGFSREYSAAFLRYKLDCCE